MIRANDRLIAVGKTGSGKTTLMKQLIDPLQRVLVLDGKGNLAHWGLTEFDDQSRIDFAEHGGKLRAVLPIGEPNAAEYWDNVLRWAFEIGNLTIYIDEINGIINPGAMATPMLHAVYTRGREFGIGVWACTQRPTWIPLICLSECEHWFCFRLSLAADRERMAQFCGDEVLHPIRDRYGFWYRSIEDDQPHYYRRLKI